MALTYPCKSRVRAGSAQGKAAQDMLFYLGMCRYVCSIQDFINQRMVRKLKEYLLYKDLQEDSYFTLYYPVLLLFTYYILFFCLPFKSRNPGTIFRLDYDANLD